MIIQLTFTSFSFACCSICCSCYTLVLHQHFTKHVQEMIVVEIHWLLPTLRSQRIDMFNSCLEHFSSSKWVLISCMNWSFGLEWVNLELNIWYVIERSVLIPDTPSLLFPYRIGHQKKTSHLLMSKGANWAMLKHLEFVSIAPWPNHLGLFGVITLWHIRHLHHPRPSVIISRSQSYLKVCSPEPTEHHW